MIEKLKADQEVDVFLAVKQVRLARPQFIQTEVRFIQTIKICYTTQSRYNNVKCIQMLTKTPHISTSRAKYGVLFVSSKSFCSTIVALQDSLWSYIEPCYNETRLHHFCRVSNISDICLFVVCSIQRIFEAKTVQWMNHSVYVYFNDYSFLIDGHGRCTMWICVRIIHAQIHDDEIPWQSFLHHWRLLCGEGATQVDLSYKELVIQNFDYCFRLTGQYID